jgi:KaiC/GvpD/RAD55 family RecA-like ATPase
MTKKHKAEPKDKKKNKIRDLLKAHYEGLTIQDIRDKTNLARHTVLARLHKFEGQGKVKMRQINMAKLYTWISVATLKEAESEAYKELKVVNLEEKNIKTTLKDKEKPENKEFNLESIKHEIQDKLHTKEIGKTEAQIQEQRAPVEHVLKNTKEKGSDKPALDIASIKSQIEEELQGKKKPKTHRGKEDEKNYIYTGIAGFDALLEKGIPKGGAILVAGGAGSGKTIFALQTLDYHASHGEKCLYMSFEESEERLIKHMEDFGWDPRKHIKDDNLLLKRFNPFEITRSVDALLMKAKGELLIDVQPIIFPNNFKPDVIVVDSLTAIASAFTGKEDSYRIYIEQLFRFFEQIGATSFLITETKQVPTVFSTTGVEEFLADGVVVMYNIKRGNIRERAIEVLKLRGAGHQHKIVAMNISSDGMEIYPEQELFGGVSE